MLPEYPCALVTSPLVSKDAEHGMVVKLTILKYGFPLTALFFKANLLV